MGRPAPGVSTLLVALREGHLEPFQAAPCMRGWALCLLEALAKKTRVYSASLLASSTQMLLITLSPGKQGVGGGATKVRREKAGSSFCKGFSCPC